MSTERQVDRSIVLCMGGLQSQPHGHDERRRLIGVGVRRFSRELVITDVRPGITRYRFSTVQFLDMNALIEKLLQSHIGDW